MIDGNGYDGERDKKKDVTGELEKVWKKKKMVSVLVIKTFESNFGTNSKILLMNK